MVLRTSGTSSAIVFLLVLRGTGYGVGWGDHTMGGGGRAEPEAGNIYTYVDIYLYIYTIHPGK